MLTRSKIRLVRAAVGKRHDSDAWYKRCRGGLGVTSYAPAR